MLRWRGEACPCPAASTRIFEALALARERGLDVLTGTCAVMHVKPGFTYHTLHKWVNQLTGKY